MADTISAATSTNETIDLVFPRVKTSDIDSATDHDWFKIVLFGGRTYQFDLVGSPADGSGLTLADPELVLRSSTGAELETNSDAGIGYNASITFAAATTAEYFLDVYGYDGGTGSYRLVANTLTTNGAANTLTLNTPAIDSLEVGDVDNWQVALTAGTTYEVSAVKDGGALIPFVEVRSTSGEVVDPETNDTGAVAAVRNFTPTVSNTYTITVRGQSYATFGPYQVKVSGQAVPVGPADVAASTATTATIAISGANQVVSGTIGAAGDSDWFKVTLAAGSRYQFDLLGAVRDGAGSGGLTLLDTVLSLRDKDGNEVASDADNGMGKNASITFTAATAGDYYLDARGSGNETGSYKLVANFFDGTGLPAILRVGTAQAGNISSSGDVDDWSVLLDGGTTYDVTMERNGGSLVPFLEVRDLGGTLVEFTGNAAGDDGASSAKLQFTPANSGVYLVETRGWQYTSAGDFTLTVAANADTIPGSLSTQTSVDPAKGLLNSSIDSVGDSDWIKVRLTQGTRYQFDLIGQGAKAGLTLANPGLILRNSSGSSEVSLTAGGSDSGAGLNAKLTYVAESTGDYILDAIGGAGTGSYRLVVNPSPVAGTLTLGTPVAASIDGADVDNWNVALTSGKTYYVSLMSNGSALDPFLEVMNGNVDVVEPQFNDDFGGTLNAYVSFTPAASGTYVIGARASGFASTGAYTLRVDETAGFFDTAAPTVSTYAPADGAGDVAVGSDLVLEFNEPIARGSGSIELKTAAGTAVASFNAATSNLLTISGNKLTINPANDLSAGADYLLEFPAGSIKDMAGNPFAASGSYNFKTAAAPVVGGPTPGNDNLVGTAGADTIDALAGDDIVDGRAGNDVLRGNAGRDVLDGGDGDDQLFGDADNDVLVGGLGSDTLNGGTGFDRADYRAASVVLEISLAGGFATAPGFNNDRDTLISIESIVGGSANDTLTGDAADNELSGGPGDDRLDGGPGVDTIDGGAGNDTATFPLARGDYLMSRNSKGVVTVADKFGVTDVLSNVETIQTASGTIATSSIPYLPGFTTPPTSSTLVYRFYNDRDKAFFYTTGVTERDNVIAQSTNRDLTPNDPVWPYFYQGATYEQGHSSAGTLSVFRFYNTTTGHHFFTTSAEERENVIKESTDPTYGEPGPVWTYTPEGPAFNAYKFNDPNHPDALPVFRFYSPTLQRHFFTASTEEAAEIRLTGVWNDEGIGYYGEVPG